MNRYGSVLPVIAILFVLISVQVTNGQVNARPCSTRPEFRAFDFFVGEWEQQNQQGRIVGATTVKLILDGCVVEETTQNPRANYAARALHYFDPALGKWRQTYVDTKAGVSSWIGEDSEGTLRYTGEISNASGSTSLGRSTFMRINKDRVRQLFETSSDGGKKWTTSWDGFYVRKAS